MVNAISVVLIRLFAAYFLLSAISLINALMWFWFAADPPSDPTFDATMYANVTSQAVMAVAGLLAWVYAKPWATKLVGASADEPYSVAAEDLIIAGSFLIGLVWVLSNLPRALLLTALAFEGDDFMSSYWVSHSGSPIDEWAGVLIGLWMMFSTRQITRMFRALRRFGQPTPSD